MPRRGVLLSGEFDTDGVDALCAELAPAANLSSPATVRMDLSQLTGLSASALAVLVATLQAVAVKGLCNPTADFVPPRDAALRNSLSAAGLGSPAGIAKGRCGVCEPFSDDQGIERAVSTALKWLKSQHYLAWDTLFTLDAMLSDFAQNVLLHADIGVGAMAMKLRPEIKSLEFAVADRGIGIRRSLAKNSDFNELRDDSAAVTTALAPGRTSEPGGARGMGLYFGKVLLVENGGTLTIRSGNARIATPPGEGDAERLPTFDGTLVTAIVRIDRPLTLNVMNRALERFGGLKSIMPARSVEGI